MRDASFTKRVRGWIVDDRIQAQAALQRLLEEFQTVFSKTQDEYFQDRLADVRDVVIRLTAHLSDVLRPEVSPLQGPLIICADELLPSQAVALGDTEVAGIVTQRGSQTSHAAIIARSRGIPAVSGVDGLLRHVSTGDTIVVDGREGHVHVNPDAEILSAEIYYVVTVNSFWARLKRILSYFASVVFGPRARSDSKISLPDFNPKAMFPYSDAKQIKGN